MSRAALLLPLLCLAAWAADKKQIGPPSMGNDFIDITASPFLTREDATKVIGVDPGPGIVVLEVKVTPKLGKSWAISPDDFTLLATNDGQRSQPYSPSQIAGSGSLVVRQGGRTSGRFGSDNPNGPIIGGMPGTGGRPMQLPGNGVGVGGGGGGGEGTASVQNQKSEANNPLLEALKAKVLPTTTSEETVSGLLYFPLEGKHKLKDLELLYKGPAGKLNIEFKR